MFTFYKPKWRLIRRDIWDSGCRWSLFLLIGKQCCIKICSVINNATYIVECAAGQQDVDLPRWENSFVPVLHPVFSCSKYEIIGHALCTKLPALLCPVLSSYNARGRTESVSSRPQRTPTLPVVRSTYISDANYGLWCLWCMPCFRCPLMNHRLTNYVN